MAAQHLQLEQDGEGAGENWWCVLFPPLCFSNGTADPEIDTEQNADTGVTLRFKIVEVFQEAKHSLSRALQKFFKQTGNNMFYMVEYRLS